MKIHLVEKDEVVEALGTSEEMVLMVPLILDTVKPQRLTFALHEGSCALLWNSKKSK